MADEEEKEEGAEEEEAKEEGDGGGEESGEGEGDGGDGEGGDGEEGEGEEGEGGKKKKKSKKLLIIIILLVVVLIGGGVGAAIFLGLIPLGEEKSLVPVEMLNEEGELPEGVDPTLQEQAVYYDVEEFIVNLNVGSKTPSFLKMTVSLELPGESYIPGVEAKMPRVRDSFQIYLRELRKEDLHGSAGMYRLREELLLRINKVVYPSRVNDILFKEILVQ